MEGAQSDVVYNDDYSPSSAAEAQNIVEQDVEGVSERTQNFVIVLAEDGRIASQLVNLLGPTSFKMKIFK